MFFKTYIREYDWLIETAVKHSLYPTSLVECFSFYDGYLSLAYKPFGTAYKINSVFL